MSSKPEQKETHQANGAVLPAVPMDCLVSPDRGQLVEPSNFLGPDGVGVEVVVLESRANAKGVREEDALLENGSQSNESDDTSTDRGPEPASPLKETSFSIGLQVLFPFLLAGFGTVAAGMVLDIVQVRLTSLVWCWALNPIFVGLILGGCLNCKASLADSSYKEKSCVSLHGTWGRGRPWLCLEQGEEHFGHPCTPAALL